MNQKDYARLDTYVSSYIQSASTELTIYSDSPALNAILSYYESLCRDRNIRTEFSLKLPDQLPISEQDLCVMMGNLLENAVNGCIECGSRDEITVNLRMKKEKLVIVCSNPCKTDLVIEDDIIKPKGTGIESILMAIDKYDGNIRYQMEDGILTACVILNC